MKIRIKYLIELSTKEIRNMIERKETCDVEWYSGVPYKVEWL